jgi:cytosine/adenosine deaminase-related metal-dependent hydrolase
MGYRKFKADYLFNGIQLLEGNKVLITNEKGKIIEITDFEMAGDDIQTYSGIISPGFINAHCHLELSHLKGIIAEKTGLADFVIKVVTLRHFPEEEILHAIALSEKEMLKNGIIAVGDICNNPSTISCKKNSKIDFYNLIETSGWLPQIAGKRFHLSKINFDEFLKNNLIASIVPHAPYSVSDELWKKMKPFFNNKVISIHNQETKYEDDLFINGKGDFIKMYERLNIDNSFYTAKKMGSVESYFEKLSTASSVILVHNTFTKQEDIDFINSHKDPEQLISFCLCPNANLYIENELPPVNLFLKNDCHIILGTDSLASNHQLNILEEMKTIANSFPEIKLETMLQWATLNGAKALQMDDNLGSFEKGKTPGIILIKNIEDGKITFDSEVRNLMAEI